MSKYLKFESKLVPLVLSRTKNSTWRLWDDKNLQAGDRLELFEFGKSQPFAEAKVTKVVEKPFGELTKEDKAGHEKYKNDKEMYKTYTGYYGCKVGPETLVKIVWFELS